MTPLSAIPKPNDMDADHTPAFLKLARILRDQIHAGDYKPGAKLPSSTTLARDHGVSRRTALHALEVLAANNHITRTSDSSPYRVA
jgi:DNA-binding GntR family transcriptional regulator